jgi:hypothetical protein
MGICCIIFCLRKEGVGIRYTVLERHKYGDFLVVL